MLQLTKSLAVAGLWLVAGTCFAQVVTPPPVNPPQAGTALRGKVLRVEGQDRIVVQTSDDKEVILMSTPTTRYIINGKAARFADIRNGANVNIMYNLKDNRHIASSVQVGEGTVGTTPATDRAFRGRIVSVDAPKHQIVAKSQDGKEVTLYVEKNGRFLRNGQAMNFADLKVGMIVEAQYTERDSHWWVDEVIVVTDNAGNGQPAGDGTQVQGVVVRIVGQNQVIVRTTDNKEVTVDLAPQTVYTFDNQPGQLRDIQQGQEIRVQYNTRERRNIAARIFGNRRK